MLADTAWGPIPIAGSMSSDGQLTVVEPGDHRYRMTTAALLVAWMGNSSVALRLPHVATAPVLPTAAASDDVLSDCIGLDQFRTVYAAWVRRRRACMLALRDRVYASLPSHSTYLDPAIEQVLQGARQKVGCHAPAGAIEAGNHTGPVLSPLCRPKRSNGPCVATL